MQCAMCEEKFEPFWGQVTVIETFQKEEETHVFCSSSCMNAGGNGSNDYRLTQTTLTHGQYPRM